MDRDGDGKVSEKELTAYLDQMRDLAARASAGCVTLVLADQSRGLFELLDTDRDGRLSVYEMRQAPKLLARLDRDGKGHLTRDDVPHNYQLTLRRGAANAGALGGAAALFNRYLSPSYKSEPDRPAVGPMWFQKMDRNRDGFVSRREFLFSDELFRKIDTDGDGLISVQEAEKADAHFRKEQKQDR
jgi:Ca2+-binding EF-hand superfamily protein